MAKKLSYADLLTDRDALKIREHILGITVTDSPDASSQHHDGRDRYMWRAYRLTGAAGGYVVGVFHGHLNGRPSLFYVERLDVAAQQVRERYSSFADCGMCAAVSQFLNARAAKVYPDLAPLTDAELTA